MAVGRAFFVWISVFNLFVVSVFWSVLADRFSNAQARRLFGFIAAGRPPTLPGVEGIVGCFLNTLPARVDLPPSAKLVDWLKEQQQTQLEREEHGHVGLPDLRRWAGVRGNLPLFESLVVFENYPLDASLASARRAP